MRTVTTDSTTGDRLTVVTRPADRVPGRRGDAPRGLGHRRRAAPAGRAAGSAWVTWCWRRICSGEGSWLRCIRRTVQAYQARSGRPFELIESCRQQLVDDPDCTGQVGVIGFCMGGGFALLVRRGRLRRRRGQLRPGARRRRRPRRGLLPDGGQLRRPGPDGISRARPDRGPASPSVPHDVEVYPNGRPLLHERRSQRTLGCDRARPLAKLSHVGPEPVAAADTWRRIEAFFAEHLRL